MSARTKILESEKVVPLGAKRTKIARTLVNLQALKDAGEPFEERDDSLIVLRDLTHAEIESLADTTKSIRDVRYPASRLGNLTNIGSSRPPMVRSTRGDYIPNATEKTTASTTTAESPTDQTILASGQSANVGSRPLSRDTIAVPEAPLPPRNLDSLVSESSTQRFTDAPAIPPRRSLSPSTTGATSYRFDGRSTPVSANSSKIAKFSVSREALTQAREYFEEQDDHFIIHRRLTGRERRALAEASATLDIERPKLEARDAQDDGDDQPQSDVRAVADHSEFFTTPDYPCPHCIAVFPLETELQ